MLIILIYFPDIMFHTQLALLICNTFPFIVNVFEWVMWKIVVLLKKKTSVCINDIFIITK